MSIPNYFNNFLKKIFENRVYFNKSLKNFSGFKTGGNADILIFPKKVEELEKLSRFCKNENFPITIIGSGTNVLIPDEGIRGITLISAFDEIEIVKKNNSLFLIRVGSGTAKKTLLNWCIEKGASGLEFSAGIPGSIGGGIYMNAGIHSKSFANVIEEITLYDFYKGIISIPKDKASFGYRSQNFIKNAFIISSIIRLIPENPKKIKKEVNLLIEERERKHPLDYPSCGSTFKNPKNFPAALLIEKANLKGKTIGGAQVSKKHANFIINTGSATSDDIKKLIELIQNIIKEQFGIFLETEIIILNPNGTFLVS